MKKVLFLSAAATTALAGVGLAQFQRPLAPVSDADLAARELRASPQIRNQLTQLRAIVQKSGRRFNLGYTPALDIPLAQLAGARVPTDLAVRAPQQNAINLKLRAIDNDAMMAAAKIKQLPELTQKPSPNLKHFDWRTLGKVTAVRSQNPCGTCWDFAPIGALESSYLIRNNETIDASEQQILDCAVGDDGKDAGSCPFPPGGWHAPVFEYLVSHGTAKEADYPYTGGTESCKGDIDTPYRAVAWGYLTTDTPAGYESLRMPTQAEIKQALCDNGPLTVTIDATPLFMAYTGGPDAFAENLTANDLTPVDPKTNLKYRVINHAIDIIGWDDTRHAWLIKNSWGQGWGDTCGFGTQRGFGWIDYDTNNIGYAAAWVRAKSKSYVLPNTYFQVKPNIKPFYEDNQPITNPVVNPQVDPAINPAINVPKSDTRRVPRQRRLAPQ